MKEAEDHGQFSYVPRQLSQYTENDDENFNDTNEVPIQSMAKV